jgi:VWFA-related protein
VLNFPGSQRTCHPFAALTVAFLLFAPGAAQLCGQGTVPAAPSGPAASAATPSGRISIDVVVTDKTGKPISGLEPGEFTLLDNGQPVKALEVHPVQAQGPTASQAHVVIVVDAINTGVNVVAREREQLGEFLKENGGELENPTSIAVLSERGLKVENGSTQDGKNLLASLDKTDSELRVEGRNTGFYGASDRLEQSLGQLSQLAAFEGSQPGRKLLLFISPGWALFARASDYEDLKQRAWVFNSVVQLTNGLREARVTLYTIGPFELGRSNPFYYQSYLKPITKPSQGEYPYLALQVLSEHTGGRVFVNGNDIRGEIDQAVRDAAAWYTLTFDAAPPGPNTEYHALRVQLDKAGLMVRTTAGYYVKGAATVEAPGK